MGYEFQTAASAAAPLSGRCGGRGRGLRWRRIAAIATVLLCAGCATPPRVSPALEAQLAAGRPPRIAGANGMLPARRTRAILSRLGREAGKTYLLERHVAVEEAAAGTPLVAGNQVTLLKNGAATYAAMFKAIRAAQHNINFNIYIFSNDKTGQKFADLLIQKQEQGVQVNLMYDSVGCLDTPRAFFERMKRAGINVLEFNPVNPAYARGDWAVNQRDHRKVLIVDGKTVFVGGVNVSGVYASRPVKRLLYEVGESAEKPPHREHTKWRDTDVEIEGPVVAEFQKLFMRAWNSQHGKPLIGRYFPRLDSRGRDLVHAIGSSPNAPVSLMYLTLISAIAHAQTYVHLTNAYFAPTPQTVEALEDAARRGVDVELVLPSVTDVPVVLYAGRSHYQELLEAGVKIFERKKALLHAKTAVIDGVWATVGSTNLDWRSVLYNYEINAVVLSATFGSEMEKMFEQDRADSVEITLEKWKHRPLGARIKQWLARMWESLL
jgi:cardiolipin synthase